MTTRGIAQGIALRNVSAENDEDLMFMAGEEIVLLERIGGGLCLGYCEGVVGQFREVDVNFTRRPRSNSNKSHHSTQMTTTPSSSSSSSSSHSTTMVPMASLPPPPIPIKNRSRASTGSSSYQGGMDQENRIQGGSEAELDRMAPIKSALARHTLASSAAAALDHGGATMMTDRPNGPRKLQSEENLRVRQPGYTTTMATSPVRSSLPSPARRQVLSSPPGHAHHHQLQPQPSTPLIPPRSTSRLLAVSGSPALSSSSPSASPSPSRSPTPSSSPLAPPLQPPSTTTAPSSFYPKSTSNKHHHHHHQHHHHNTTSGLLSPPAQFSSAASSMADLYSSSATITTNSLGIKSHVFLPDPHHHHPQHHLLSAGPSPYSSHNNLSPPPPLHSTFNSASESVSSSVGPTQSFYGVSTPHRLSPSPIHQLSTPSSSTHSLSSKAASPVLSSAMVAKASFVSYSSTMASSHGFRSVTPAASTGQMAELHLGRGDQEDEGYTPSVEVVGPVLSRGGEGGGGRAGGRVKERIDQGSSSLIESFQEQEEQEQEQGHQCPDEKQHHSNNNLHSNQQQQQQQPNHQGRTSMLDDIRSKTHHVLRKAGFSIAPEAGLFADRGSKEMDLKVVRMSGSSFSGPSGVLFVAGGHGGGESGSLSTVTIAAGTGKQSSQHRSLAQNQNRPRSKSIKEASHPLPPPPPPHPLPSQSRTSQESSHSFLEKFRPWASTSLDHRQRSNSGPARHSDSSLSQKLMRGGYPEEESGSLGGEYGLPSVEEGGENSQVTGGSNSKQRMRRSRRTSENTTLTVGSTKSAQALFGHGGGGGGEGLPPSSFGSELLPPPTSSGGSSMFSTTSSGDSKTKHQSRSKSHWFSKRRSYHSVEDSRKPHPFGHGIQGGIQAPAGTSASRQTSGVFTETDIEDEEEEEDGEEEEDDDRYEDGESAGGSGRRTGTDHPTGDTSSSTTTTTTRLFVNNYGFIYDPEKESPHPEQEFEQDSGSRNGSMVGDWSSSSLGGGHSTSEHERRKKVLRQQEYIRENEAKWVHAVTLLQADHVKKSSKYKKLVRRGIPTSVRGRVWQFLARADYYRQPGLFEQLLKRGPLPIHEVIERDIHRCYPDHVHFRDGMGGTGQRDLHAILKAYAHYKPSVGYCQGMGRLVGMMLMQMPVEDAFWLLVATIEGYLPDYYTPTLRQLRIDAQVFEKLLAVQDPKLADHLMKQDVIPLMYMTPWFLTLFTMSLPWASVLRVWDIFYFDGVKALFRVGLAVCQICREYLLGGQCPSSSELMACLLHVPLEWLGPEVLLQTAFRIRLKRETIARWGTQIAEALDEEAAVKAKAKAAKAKKDGIVEGQTPETSMVSTPSPDTIDGDSSSSLAPSDTMTTATATTIASTTELNNENSSLSASRPAPPQQQQQQQQQQQRPSSLGRPRSQPAPTSTSSSSSSSSTTFTKFSSQPLPVLPPPSLVPLNSSTPTTVSSPFSLGGVFRTRKRAGTIHQ